MPQDLSPENLADLTRDRYSDAHGDMRHLYKSAAWDAASVTLALQHVRLAKSAVKSLAAMGDLDLTMELGADDGDEMVSLNLAEDGLTRALEALRRL
jgi:hypothetical protein